MSLTVDILTHIFKYCPYFDLLSCHLVCKLWLRVIEKHPDALWWLPPIDWSTIDRYPLNSFVVCPPICSTVVNEEPIGDEQDLTNMIQRNLNENVYNINVYYRLFRDDNIEHVYFYKDGVPDEESWYILGQLCGGIYFFMDASCDYTGFDCKGAIHFTFARSLHGLIMFGTTSKPRRLLAQHSYSTK
jgi:hypothetical protein